MKSALRDPCLELDVSGKLLQNDGFQEVASALVKVIRHNGEQGTILRLEELCLKGNKLDSASLPILSLVVKVAALDLRDLDLSDNLFEITTSQQAHVWEEFLHSFADTRMLRRLDLSGNKLSPKAFEVLARVYSREPTIDLTRQDGAQNDFHCTDEESERLLQSTSKLRIATYPRPRASEDKNLSPADTENRQVTRHGLSAFLLAVGMVDVPNSQTRNPRTRRVRLPLQIRNGSMLLLVVFARSHT